MIGHSVNTLKLNMPFGRTLEGASGVSAAGDLGEEMLQVEDWLCQADENEFSMYIYHD